MRKSSTNETDGETTPLTASRRSTRSNQENGAGEEEDDNGDGSRSQRPVPPPWTLISAAVLGIALIAMGSVAAVFSHRPNKQNPEQQIVEAATSVLYTTSGGSPPDQVRYRPLCEYYGENNDQNNPTKIAIPMNVLQTSMTAPSVPWSKQECRPTLLSSRDTSEAIQHQVLPRLGHPTTKIVPLNSYGAPDAILRVNFSHVAFAHRESAILGFGGAFTEAAALNYGRLTQEGKDTVMELLFGQSGLGYSIGRVPINSCDFSVQSYSFDETDHDFTLAHFDMGVHHDVESGMVDMALRATSVFRHAWTRPTKSSRGPPVAALENVPIDPDGTFRLYASPWSPPAWMKQATWQDPVGAMHASNMTYSAQPTCLRGGVGPNSRHAQAWARYFSKFATAYANLGLPLWAVTVQNEPEFPAPWEACAYTPETQHDFVANHLGPQLRKDHPNLKLLVFDHNKDHINVWAETLLNASSQAAPYVDGIAYHWYAGGMDRLLDGALGIPNLHRLQDKLQGLGLDKSQLLLGSESCHCPTTGYAGGDIENYWSRAERYAHTILADLAAGSHGWLEWNLILDGIGGPNHLGNLCESTLLAVPHRAKGMDPNYPSLPYFEKQLPFNNVSIGEGRSREELNALGFPAKYLDLGIVVQPIYYYMGHISRYVRPGSYAVMGLVNGAATPPGSTGGGRIFRRGLDVAGGGINDLARDGIELTVWPCEGSTRQHFKWDEQGQHIVATGHDWLGVPTKWCVARQVDKDFKGLRLTSCDAKEAGEFDVLPVMDAGPNVYNVVLRNHPKTEGLCMAIDELKNNGGAYGARGGAQVSLGDCSHPSANWILDKDNGEASSLYFDRADSYDQSDELVPDVSKEVCLTTGWPFLQMGAFLTPNGDAPKTVVILNEAKDSANFALQDENGVVLTSSIAPRSIQTLLLK